MNKLIFIISVSIFSCTEVKETAPKEIDYIQLEFVNYDGTIEKSTILQVR